MTVEMRAYHSTYTERRAEVVPVGETLRLQYAVLGLRAVLRVHRAKYQTCRLLVMCPLRGRLLTYLRVVGQRTFAFLMLVG